MLPRRRIGAISLIMAMFVALAACGGGGNDNSRSNNDGPPVRGGSAVWLTNGESTVAPNAYAIGVSYKFAAVYDSLVGINPETGEPVFRQAESVTPNEDNSVWTIKLRAGLKFTDGTPFDAQAIADWWDYSAAPENGMPSQSTLAGFAGWKVLDDTTLEVNIGYPRGSFYNDLSLSTVVSLGMIPSPTMVKNAGDAFGTSAKTFAAAGPFKIQEWVNGDHMTLVRNPDYWDPEKPYLDELTFKVTDGLADGNVDAILSGAGQLAYQNTPNPAHDRLVEAGGQKIEGPENSMVTAPFNIRPPFDDLRVRQAMVLASKVSDLPEKVVPGSVAVTTFFPEESAMYDPDVVQDSDDLEAAQALVDEYLAETGESTIEGTFLTPNNSTSTWGLAVVQNLNRLDHVNFEVDQRDLAAFATARSAGEFDLTYNYSPAPGTATEEYRNQYYTGGTGNIGNFSDPALDKLLDETRGAATVEDRKAALSQITAELFDQAALIGMFYKNTKTIAGGEVGYGSLLDPSSPNPDDIWIKD